MGKPRLSHEKKQHALVLRSLGVSAQATADYLDVSIRSVQRLWSTHGAEKGDLSEELLTQCRERLKTQVLSEEGLNNAIVVFLADEVAHTRRLRDRMAGVFEEFDPQTDRERALFMRASAAYSTALKNTSDIMRKALDIDTFREMSGIEVLPELVIRVMSPEDELRERERQQSDELNDYGS